MTDMIYDIAVVGGGPAGLSAAITGSIRNKKVIIFEHFDFGHKLLNVHQVHNYPGYPKVSGQKLIQQMAEHCLSFEPTLVKEKVMNIFPGEVFTLATSGAVYEARTVILAIGVVNTALLPGEKDLLGRGVSYCATCDGMFFKDKNVAIIAYTDEGKHEAKFLGEICKEVYYLPQFKTADTTEFSPNVKVMAVKPTKIKGTEQVEGLVTDAAELLVDGVFIFRQSDPVENILPELELEGAVIKVKRDMSTNLPGVFAAGDCAGMPWQIAKAAGEGQVAALSAIGYLAVQAVSNH
jgi:thioredoxin reductase (NADPH)